VTEKDRMKDPAGSLTKEKAKKALDKSKQTTKDPNEESQLMKKDSSFSLPTYGEIWRMLATQKQKGKESESQQIKSDSDLKEQTSSATEPANEKDPTTPHGITVSAVMKKKATEDVDNRRGKRMTLTLSTAHPVVIRGITY
jgi:hypothetical protein